MHYLPIAISARHVTRTAAQLQRDYPTLAVLLVAHYSHAVQLPARAAGASQHAGFFPGSTIRNFSHHEAVHFLRMAQVLRGGAQVLGADLVKDPARLHAAYHDVQGVTIALNLNLRVCANRELRSDSCWSQFAHSAFYSAPLPDRDAPAKLTRHHMTIGGQR